MQKMTIKHAAIIVIMSVGLGLATQVPQTANASYDTRTIPTVFRHRWYGENHQIYNQFTAKHGYYHVANDTISSKVKRVKVYSAHHIRVGSTDLLSVTLIVKGHTLAAYTAGRWTKWHR